MFLIEVCISLLVIAVVLFCVCVVILYLFLLYTNTKNPRIIRYEDEKYFRDLKSGDAKCRFPSLSDPFSVDLSVIIPAYNEEDRLPTMLDECVDFLETRSKEKLKFSYEIIIVDDGSKDMTTPVGLTYGEKIGVEKLRVLTLTKNRGKGGAVRFGMLSARGKYLLFADADGATKFEDLIKLEEAMRKLQEKKEMCVVVGSRAHLEKDAMATRSTFRTILMIGFHVLVWLFGIRNVRDTQCGFKLFTRKAAQVLFNALHVERWAFDVELLYLANELSMQIDEVAVNWTEIEGSKLVPFWSWLQMGKDLVLIWFKYQTKLWTIDTKMKQT